MNATEGITLTKMAITAMLVSLVLLASFSIWYFLSDKMSDVQRSMDNAVSTAATERLYELQEMSLTATTTKEYDDYPLVTNVCNALSEYNEDSLLFVYCTAHDIKTNTYSNSHWYTYDGVTISPIPTSWPGYSSATQLYPHTQIPVTYAVKQLLSYSKYRCNMNVVEYEYQQTPTSNSMTYVGVIVEVLVND